MSGPGLASLLVPGSGVFALAVSSDERLIAVGGAVGTPVRVFDRANRRMLDLGPMGDEVAALAFTPGGDHLVAITLRGARARWALPDGRLVAESPPTDAGRYRSIAFRADVDANLGWPRAVTDHLAGTARRALAPGGAVVAEAGRVVELTKYRGHVIASLDLAAHGLDVRSVPAVGWSGDGQKLAVVTVDSCVLWAPMADGAGMDLRIGPAPRDLQPGGGVAVLGDGVLCATGGGVAVVDSLDPVTPWRARAVSDSHQSPPPDVEGRRDWNWGVTSAGYEGVTDEGTGLLWYSHSHNPHAGGGAFVQSYVDFLSAGPPVSVPADVLAEVTARATARTAAP